MLRQLYIRNFTLIDELDIEFHSGFSVITGETGAGKSIILGAIGLLLGNRADSKAIKKDAAKCIIEAHFDLSKYGMESFFTENDIEMDLEDTIIRRELTAAGKSRAFINDTPVSLNELRQLGEQLIDIHSQHQNLLLQKEDFQLNVVDIIAKDSKQIAAYQAKYNDYRKAQKQLDQLRENIANSKENEEFLRFQWTELDKANLVEGQLEELEQEGETLNHSEEIKSALFESDNLLSGDGTGAVEQIKKAASNLHSIENVYPEVAPLAQRLESSYIELKDIAEEVNSDVERIDFDPAHLDEINQRLDTLYALQQKFHAESIEELIATRDNLKEQLSHIDNSDEDLAELEAEVAAKLKACETEAQQLTQLRLKSAKKVEEEMSKRLIPLGIPNVRFKVEITDKPIAADGKDKVSFLFSANTSTQMQPVSMVASGGEIARVMLSLKAMISGAVKLPTIIFDEIDTGVSGKIAEKMAQIMVEMGNNDRQVISITHLPQIAALGSIHYKVSKEETPQGTASHMTMLNENERIQEIAQMLSGSAVSEAALANARELLGK